MKDDTKLVKITDISEVFQVTDRTVKNWLNQGMPKYQVGKTIRFDIGEVKEWMKSHGEATD